MNRQKVWGAIEAILFSAGDSIELSRIAKAVELEKEETKKVIQEMMNSYEREDRGIKIIELEQSYQLCSKKEYYECLIRLAMHPKNRNIMIIW